MKSTARNALLAFIGSITTAFAANGAEKAEPSIGLYVFLGFGALIIVFQAIPGIMLFVSMLKGILVAPKEQVLAKKSDKAS